jgi:hypothetical protein
MAREAIIWPRRTLTAGRSIAPSRRALMLSVSASFSRIAGPSGGLRAFSRPSPSEAPKEDASMSTPWPDLIPSTSKNRTECVTRGRWRSRSGIDARSNRRKGVTEASAKSGSPQVRQAGPANWSSTVASEVDWTARTRWAGIRRTGSGELGRTRRVFEESRGEAAERGRIVRDRRDCLHFSPRWEGIGRGDDPEIGYSEAG